MNFEQWVLNHEPTIRLGFFIGVFLLIALWERWSPSRVRLLTRTMRWSHNLLLLFLNTALLRLLFPITAVALAALAAERGWGILNQLEWSLGLKIVVAVVVMDLVIWIQHVLVHAVPVLWRLHRVHHADLDYDVTTGARFHPIEIVLSMLIKFATLLVLGPPVVAVVIFEVILNAMAMFNHGNIRLPQALDGVLRLFVVTPDMHRVHHSREEDEANSNFGFNLSLWDRLLGTYRAEPRKGQQGMEIGIEGYTQADEVNTLQGMLSLPFKGKITRYVINSRSWQPPQALHEQEK